MSVDELTALTLIGLATGLVGGMLGVGGSIVMIPAMTEVLGPDQHLYQAAAMIVNFFVVVPAVYQHRRARAIQTGTVLRLMPLAVVSSVAGVLLSELRIFADENEAYLRLLFGLFLLVFALTDLCRAVVRHRAGNGAHGGVDTEVPRAAGWRTIALVAVPTGLLSGFLGLGGGVLAVPLQQRLLRTPIRTAIANSATLIVAISLVGAIAKNYAVVRDLEQTHRSMALASILIPTAIGGSLIGSRLTHALPLRWVKAAFLVLLLLAALRLTHGAFTAAPIHVGRG
jgi:uncharacterized membrane protein YfcA